MPNPVMPAPPFRLVSSAESSVPRICLPWITPEEAGEASKPRSCAACEPLMSLIENVPEPVVKSVSLIDWPSEAMLACSLPGAAALKAARIAPSVVGASADTGLTSEPPVVVTPSDVLTTPLPLLPGGSEAVNNWLTVGLFCRAAMMSLAVDCPAAIWNVSVGLAGLLLS